mgnify:CR=1 FL=1
MAVNVMLIRGKVTNIWDNEDFARMLRDLLGSDAEYYFRHETDPDAVLNEISDAEMLNYCSGECSNVEEAIEHWTGVLQEVQEELEEIQSNVQFKTKDETSIALLQLIQKINAEL